MKAILDTSMLVAESLSHPGYDVSISSLSWAELGYGLRKAANPVERTRREARVAWLRAVLGAGIPFDDACAEAYETVCGLVLAGGRDARGRAIDLMIAATAATQGAAVTTRNADDVTGLDGLITVVVA